MGAGVDLGPDRRSRRRHEDPRDRFVAPGGAIGSRARCDRLVAPVLSRLPPAVVNGPLADLAPRADVQASNVPGWPIDTYVCGAKVERFIGFGPLPGAAMMVVLLSSAGNCTIGVNYDPAAVNGRTSSRPAWRSRSTRWSPSDQPGRRRDSTWRCPAALGEIEAGPERPRSRGVLRPRRHPGRRLHGPVLPRGAAAQRRDRCSASCSARLASASAVSSGVRGSRICSRSARGVAGPGRRRVARDGGAACSSEKIADRGSMPGCAGSSGPPGRGHTVVLASSATSYQVEPVARAPRTSTTSSATAMAVDGRSAHR